MNSKLGDIFIATKREPIPKDWKLIGFFESPQTNDELNVLAIAMGMDKSKLLRKIVSDYLDKNDPLESVVEKVKELRNSEKAQGMPIIEFKSKIKAFLSEKKVPNELIKKVLHSI